MESVQVFLYLQILSIKEFELIAEDYQVKAAKTGMLADATLINTVVKIFKGMISVLGR